MRDPFHVVTCFFAFHLIIDAFVYVFSRVDIAYHVYRNTSKNTQNWNCWHTQAGHLGCTLSSEMWCMSGFSLHKQQSIPTVEREGKKTTVESFESFVKLESCWLFLDQWCILWMQWCWKCDRVDFTSDDVSTWTWKSLWQGQKGIRVISHHRKTLN